MTPVALLAHLRSLGFRVAAEGDRLTVSGKPALLTAELRERIVAAKPALLDLLWFEMPFRDSPFLRRWGKPEPKGKVKQEEKQP